MLTIEQLAKGLIVMLQNLGSIPPKSSVRKTAGVSWNDNPLAEVHFPAMI
jgi:hypothetical protein